MIDIKILIVDTNEAIANKLKSNFENVGHNVLKIVSDCEKAMSFLEESKEDPDLILLGTDLESDGLELVLELHQQELDIPLALSNTKNTESLLSGVPNLGNVELLANFDLDKKRKIELQKLKKANKMANMQIEELMQTQQHLITATWRERELKEELSNTKGLVEEKNKKIQDSINYAKRIQKAIIPKQSELSDALGDYFMFYKPKDTVSGDFPWLFVRDKFVYIAAVDCTGHGVPGAMMSLIGFLLLNNVMGNHEAPLPSQILNELHREVVNTLRQNDEENSAADGMDVAICRIDKTSGEVMYSGAHRPLYHCVDSEIIQFKGDKYPVGGMQYKGKNTFTDSEVRVNKGEAIYFFSDGLPDQFGGPEKLKFGPKKIRDLIIENNTKPMSEQERIFTDAFNDWKGDIGQIDDILLVGIKF